MSIVASQWEWDRDYHVEIRERSFCNDPWSWWLEWIRVDVRHRFDVVEATFAVLVIVASIVKNVREVFMSINR